MALRRPRVYFIYFESFLFLIAYAYIVMIENWSRREKFAIMLQFEYMKWEGGMSCLILQSHNPNY